MHFALEMAVKLHELWSCIVPEFKLSLVLRRFSKYGHKHVGHQKLNFFTSKLL